MRRVALTKHFVASLLKTRYADVLNGFTTFSQITRCGVCFARAPLDCNREQSELRAPSDRRAEQRRRAAGALYNWISRRGVLIGRTSVVPRVFDTDPDLARRSDP